MVAQDPTREIEVNWDSKILDQKENKYKFTFNVLVYDKPNVLMNIINLVANHKIHLVTINSNQINKNGENFMNFQITIEISNKNEYKYQLTNMLKMKEIISVDRS